MAQPIGQMNIVLSANAATFSEAISQAQRQLDKLAGASKQAGHSTVSSVQAASGALRELNGDFVNNIRAVERFITTIPGVGNALKAAFPVVGGIALLAMLGEMVVKMAAVTKAAGEMPNKIRDGFRELNDASQMATDELRLVNDNLEMQINKLRGKPENNLKIALHESWIEADKLSKSLAEGASKVKELLSQNKVGTFSPSNIVSSVNAGMGQDATADVSGTVNYYNAKMREAGFQKNIAVHNGDTDAAARHQRELDDATVSYTKWLDEQHKMRTGTVAAPGNDNATYASVHGPQTSNLNIIEGERTRLFDVQAAASAQGDHARDEVSLKSAEVDKEKAEAAKRANAEARAAQRKAAEAQMKGFEGNLAGLKNNHDVSLAEEYAFWQQMAKAAAAYPENLLKVREKTGQLYQEMGRFIEEFLRKSDTANREAARKVAEAVKQWDALAIKLDEEMSKQQRRAADFTAKLREVNQGNADSLAELTIAHDVATGAISKHSAAMQAATLHASTYQAKLQALRDENDADKEDTSLTDEQRNANKEGRDVQAATIQGEADRTAASDKWREFNETGLGGATMALQRFMAATTDYSQMVETVLSSSISRTNQAILEHLTTRHAHGEHIFGNAGADIFKGVTNSALQGAEGSLMKVLGLGKGKAPTGAAGDPLHVIAHGIAGAVSAVGSAASSGAGWLKSGMAILKSLNIPGYAEGTNYAAGGLSLVGEREPEFVNLPRGATVTPLSKVAFGGGGDTHHHHYNIDARGASNPAEVEYAIRRAAPSIAAQGAAMAISHLHEKKRRSPLSQG